ncbi:hypothetical protein [Streptomyces sp. NPDC087856]|uniref:hypothetical protein n=1 Tax=Streptomyces sp. NPDC087856 TaxID=3365811 RepID=UPI00381C96EF
MGTVKRLDGNLILDDDEVRCRHCSGRVGTGANWLADALVRQQPAQDAGLKLPVSPTVYVDQAVVCRQAFCPGCLTVLLTEVVAESDAGLRSKILNG